MTLVPLAIQSSCDKAISSEPMVMAGASARAAVDASSAMAAMGDDFMVFFSPGRTSPYYKRGFRMCRYSYYEYRPNLEHPRSLRFFLTFVAIAEVAGTWRPVRPKDNSWGTVSACLPFAFVHIGWSISGPWPSTPTSPRTEPPGRK